MYNDETVSLEERQYSIHYYGNSYVGERKDQQDSYGIEVNGDDTLAVICDGMGGLSGGKAASQLAVDDFMTNFHLRDNEDIPRFLYNTVIDADKKIVDMHDRTGRQIIAGSTAVAVYIEDDQMYYVSVGDSRIYMFRENQMAQLTQDHNYATLLEEEKENMSKEVYEREKKRGESLISYLGMNGLKRISYNPHKAVDLYPGDYILLCSDGLYKKLSDQQIEAILKDVDYMGIENTVKALQNEARNMPSAKKQDNTSVILLGYI